jgi:hypothetical protein
MAFVLRVSRPGVNALTDTNPDHYSIFADQDNVLIKEFTRGEVSVGAGVDKVIFHGLRYVPFFLVYVNETSLSSNAWALVGIGSILSMSYAASANVSDLIISNFTGSDRTFKYFIFYDNQVGLSGNIISESKDILKISKQDFNAKTDKDPNNLILHSDLNSFKIIYQGQKVINFNSGASDYSFSHNSPLPNTTCMYLFVRFPDGKISPVSWYGGPSNSVKAYSNLQGIDGKAFDGAYFDNSNIYVHNLGVVVAYDVTFVWYIFEASL